MQTSLTTTEQYDAQLAQATEALSSTLRQDGFPEGEREKAISDALNNTWVEGITLAAWVEQANARI